MASIYDTNTLLGVINLKREPTLFLSNYFFPDMIAFDTETIYVDLTRGSQRLAPFVSPCVEGVAVTGKTIETKIIKPGYLKPKMALTPSITTRRMPGEAFGGQFSPQQRRDMQIESNLLELVGRIESRVEWMAAQALVFGFVDIVGDGYPLARVDFLRSPTHQTILAGANLWSAATGTPVTNIEQWANIVSSDMGGSVTDIVLGANVWSQLSKNPEFRGLYNFFQPIGGGLPSMLPGVADNDMKIYRGQIGPIRIWSLNATFFDDAGLAQFFIPPNDVILVARQEMKGVRSFGAIMDNDALVSAPYWPKQWTQPDPSVTFTMVQSAPMVIPQNVDSVFRATVL